MARSVLYHVCIVVPELEGARAHLAELLGVEWGPIRQFDLPYRDPDGTAHVARGQRLCYSIEAPHLELVEAVPGTPWTCNDQSNVHHLGYLVDDVDAGTRRLTAAGCPLEALGVDDVSGVSGWAYHRDDLGVRLEIVATATASATGSYLLGGNASFDAPLTTTF